MLDDVEEHFKAKTRIHSPEGTCQSPLFLQFSTLPSSLSLLGSTFHIQDVFLELQHVDLWVCGSRRVNDSDGLEFHPSNCPRCCNSYNILDVESFKIDLYDEFLQFWTDYDPRWAHAGVQCANEGM